MSNSQDAGASGLPSHEVERRLARHFWESGYEVEPGGSASTGSRFDGGVDLVLRRDGQTVLVQCKHWKTAAIPPLDVQLLLGLLETRQAQRGILVAGGGFSDAARDAANQSGRIELIDGAALSAILGKAPPPASRLWWLLGAALLAVFSLLFAHRLFPA